MELKDYIKTIKNNLLFITFCIAITATIAYIAGSSAKSGYKTEQTFLLVSMGAPQTTGNQLTGQPFDFGNYYNQEKARNFTDTAVSILESQDFNADLLGAGSTITVQKVSPQLIKISAFSQNASDSKFVIERVFIDFNQKLKILDPANSLQIKAVGTSREPSFSRLNIKVIVAAASVLGLVLALFTISLKSYFKL